MTNPDPVTAQIEAARISQARTDLLRHLADEVAQAKVEAQLVEWSST